MIRWRQMKKTLLDNIVEIMNRIATQMGGSCTQTGGGCTQMGGKNTKMDVQMGGSCTQMGGGCTQMYTQNTADGTQMCVKMIAGIAVKVRQLLRIATQMCGFRGIRDLPDKCVCDTNAYLARIYKNCLHPDGWQTILHPDGCTDFQAGTGNFYQRGPAYE